jgi:hypothetical protein
LPYIPGGPQTQREDICTTGHAGILSHAACNKRWRGRKYQRDKLKQNSFKDDYGMVMALALYCNVFKTHAYNVNEFISPDIKQILNISQNNNEK